MYPEALVVPMKSELTEAGFEDLTTPVAVDKAVSQPGTTLLVFNSVCGCSAGAARPGILMALENEKKPDHLVTVFAGFDVEATSQARKYTLPYPPSSPSMGLFKDGKLVHFIERYNIEGHSANMVAAHLKAAFDEYCA
ncbi:MAG TPA: BrxA/BrxB family bacilliredoxin [Bacteroidia bacterium]|nr:BrxA/BrxB family bacilliredoxin [Bacteroidia bacterium]